MTPLEEIQKHAEVIGLTRYEHLGKEQLIRAIQEEEGHEPCFNAPWCNFCRQAHCFWKDDCSAVGVSF